MSSAAGRQAGVTHFHEQIRSDIKKGRSGALVSDVFAAPATQLRQKGLFVW